MFSCHFISFDELKIIVMGPRVSDAHSYMCLEKKSCEIKEGGSMKEVHTFPKFKKCHPQPHLLGIFLLKLFLLIKTQTKRAECTLEIKRFKHVFFILF